MNGFLATAFYNAQTAVLFVHAFVPFPPLLRVSDQCIQFGNAFQAAQLRADQTRRHP